MFVTKFEVLGQYFPGEIEKNHWNTSFKEGGIRFEKSKKDATHSIMAVGNGLSLLVVVIVIVIVVTVGHCRVSIEVCLSETDLKLQTMKYVSREVRMYGTCLVETSTDFLFPAVSFIVLLCDSVTKFLT